MQSRRLTNIFPHDKKQAEESISCVEMGDMKHPLPDEEKDHTATTVTVSSRSQSTSDRTLPFSDDLGDRNRDRDRTDYIEQVVDRLHGEGLDGRGDPNQLSRSQSSESTAVGDEAPQTVRSMLDV